MNAQTRLSFGESKLQGYRLWKLEILNWGTFDGQVFTICPSGKSTLLIGQNGSGKSTLVDALLTLLVRPGVRNFNVAAGAKKRERDERTYLRGAYDRGGDEEGQGAPIKYLRPKGDHYSAILACFRNADLDKSFTVAQLLYLANDQSVDKVYCFSDEERSIQADFEGLASTERLLKTLRQRGFRATKTFQEFENWFNKATRVKPKAMEVFNQTVAVKDIPRLNDFIRDHMLESRDWGEKVDCLLGHFTQLSEAHDCLVRLRQQSELLEPVARRGEEFRREAEMLDRREQMSLAAAAFFAQKTIEIFTPQRRRHENELEETIARNERLTDEIGAAQESARRLKNEIDHAGGERLRQIPLLIDTQRAMAEQKRVAAGRFDDALQRLGLSRSFSDEAGFTAFRARLPDLQTELESAAAPWEAEREHGILQRGETRRTAAALQAELEGLNRRRENIPQRCVDLRQALCAELGLVPRELPFAAELMQVLPESQPWEASIEKVLRGFALSLLVPDMHYRLVSAHVERTRLTVDGRGQRLVYLRVAEQAVGEDEAQLDRRLLFHKLAFREGHPLLPWLKAELRRQFDYVCCETVEDFQHQRGRALTRNRHVKSGRERHDKDDREAIVDPRNFVLGWDNREKKQRIAAEIARLARQESQLDDQLASCAQKLDELQSRRSAVAEALRVTNFAEIAFEVHEHEIEALQRERRQIEEQSDVIQALKARLAAAEAQEQALQAGRDEAIRRETELKAHIKQAEQLLDNARAELDRCQADDGFARYGEALNDLEAAFSPPLAADDLFVRKDRFRAELETEIRKLREALDPLRVKLLEAMTRFLRMCPEETADLRPAIDYLDSFLGLRQRIIDDDLPRHERRFKERLNQKVIEEIGLFRGALDQERRGIEDKIELLNSSLKKLKYRGEMHIRLEARPIRDAEIAEFQGKLRECVEGSFEDSAEANEARFLRIKDLIVRLQDDDDHRWRNKVTDVRRWFDFAAAVVAPETGKPVSVYRDSSGQSGGEKAKLAFTILVAAIAYQYDLDPERPLSDRFHFVVVNEMFSKVDDQHAEYALKLFEQFGLQLLIVAPLDAKARVTQPYVGCYLHAVKKDNRSTVFEMTAREFEETATDEQSAAARRTAPAPR
jgi:uncharacterized protein YPO0396